MTSRGCLRERLFSLGAAVILLAAGVVMAVAASVVVPFVGLVAAGLGFAVLAVGAARTTGGAQVSPMWLVSVYLLHTVGELCLSPVGLSAMTKLAPARIGSLLMGVWFLSLSVGNYLGGRIASHYEALPLANLFWLIAAFGLGAGLGLALLVKPTKALMGGLR